MTNTSNKNVFITGGTGTVGQALLNAFYLKNYNIYFHFNSENDLANELEKKFNAKSFQINFSSNYILPNINFDIIINNAAVNLTDALTHEITDEIWTETLLINLETPFKIVRKYLPNMLLNKWGRIINISSIYALRAVEGNFPYTVSKHGLSGLTKTIAKEYAIYGITCNEICPAAINSKMMQRIAKDGSKKENISVEKYLQNVADEIPAGRMVDPNEIAVLAVFLASDDAKMINGCSIQIDGGLIC